MCKQDNAKDNQKVETPKVQSSEKDTFVSANPSSIEGGVDGDTSKSPLKRVIPVVIVALSAIALLVGVRLTMAAFSASDFLKSVVATNETANLLSSDMLAGYNTVPNEPEYPEKTITVSNSGEMTSFDFSIFNYFEKSPETTCQKNINYVLTIKVTGGTDGASYSIGVDGLTTPFGSKGVTLAPTTLTGRQKSEKKYTVSFPTSELGKAKFVVSVDVRDSGGTNVRFMAAKIEPCVHTEVVTNSVSVTCVEKKNGLALNDCAGYDYEVAANGAPASVTLGWNKEYVQLDSYFSDNHNATVNKDNSTVTFDAVPGETITVTFLRLNGKTPSSWDDVAWEVKAGK